LDPIYQVDYLDAWGCGNCWPQYPAAKVRVQNRMADARATWVSMAALLKKVG
jgi:hypothetical protein